MMKSTFEIAVNAQDDGKDDPGGSGSADMASVMGFSGFGGAKKAKQFDLMAMYEQTRKTAIERSQKTFEKREDNEQTEKMEKISSKMKSASVDQHNSSDSEDEIIGPVPRHSHTKTSAQSDGDDDDDMIGPPIPGQIKRKNTGPSNREPDSDDDDEDDDEDDNPLKKIPVSQEVVLNHGSRVVSALGLDPSGARLVSGGADYDVKLWDFAGMDASLQSFRKLRPCESHQIKGLEYSTTGDMILVISGNSQAKLIDRDGFEVLECIKGDQYIVDQTSTKGHTAMLNNGCWHPKQREEFMTCSNDGTLRLWNTKNGQKHKNVIKTKSKGGRKTVPTACAYNRDGTYVAAACQDGSIQIWDHRKNFVNVSLKNMAAHQDGTDTSCLCFSYDGNVLASRGGCGDDTVKLWDVRKFKEPLCVAKDLENLFPMTDVVFSPDDRLVVTGISVRKGHGTGKLVFMDRQTLMKVADLDVAEGASVVRCLWHPRLNQMVASSSDGDIKVYYDPDTSHRGAKLCVIKTKPKAKEVQMIVGQNIITPYALPMFRQDRPTTTRKQELKDRKDPIKSHRPELPMSGPGRGGRLANKGATLAQYVAQGLVMRKPDERDKDPRAAILRHAKDAAENPYWVDPAYTKSQPEPIFQPLEKEEDKKDDEIEPMWKKQKI